MVAEKAKINVFVFSRAKIIYGIIFARPEENM